MITLEQAKSLAIIIWCISGSFCFIMVGLWCYHDITGDDGEGDQPMHLDPNDPQDWWKKEKVEA